MPWAWDPPKGIWRDIGNGVTEYRYPETKDLRLNVWMARERGCWMAAVFGDVEIEFPLDSDQLDAAKAEAMIKLHTWFFAMAELTKP